MDETEGVVRPFALVRMNGLIWKRHSKLDLAENFLTRAATIFIHTQTRHKEVGSTHLCREALLNEIVPENDQSSEIKSLFGESSALFLFRRL